MSSIPTSATECCGVSEPFKRRTVRENALQSLRGYANSTARIDKVLVFCDRFPEALRFIEENELDLY
jgi:hypothetical protein